MIRERNQAKKMNSKGITKTWRYSQLEKGGKHRFTESCINGNEE